MLPASPDRPEQVWGECPMPTRTLLLWIAVDGSHTHRNNIVELLPAVGLVEIIKSMTVEGTGATSPDTKLQRLVFRRPN